MSGFTFGISEIIASSLTCPLVTCPGLSVHNVSAVIDSACVDLLLVTTGIPPLLFCCSPKFEDDAFFDLQEPGTETTFLLDETKGGARRLGPNYF